MAPDFWKTKLSDVEDVLKLVKKGRVDVLCKSAGGREIKIVEYGDKEDLNRKANYNSACGAANPNYYANKAGKKPVILFVGAVHGLEMEGIVAINNLITMIETGYDFKGKSNDYFGNVIKDCRLLLIPVMNVDGRARFLMDTMEGLTEERMHYYSQGTWKDGTLCNWPDCKAVHPILDHVDLLGGYYNDKGINMMHDNFFLPMAEETIALMRLVDEQAPDYIVLLHGGGNMSNGILQPPFVPDFVNTRIDELAHKIKAVCDEKGFAVSIVGVPDNKTSPPLSFNLACALHHICGGVPIVYESNQALNEENRFTCEEILEHHYILFEQTIKAALQEAAFRV